MKQISIHKERNLFLPVVTKNGKLICGTYTHMDFDELIALYTTTAKPKTYCTFNRFGSLCMFLCSTVAPKLLTGVNDEKSIDL